MSYISMDDMSKALDKIKELEDKLATSEQNVKDFERLAQEWKKGYSDLEIKHKVKITELNQIIEELEKEIIDLGKV